MCPQPQWQCPEAAGASHQNVLRGRRPPRRASTPRAACDGALPLRIGLWPGRRAGGSFAWVFRRATVRTRADPLRCRLTFHSHTGTSARDTHGRAQLYCARVVCTHPHRRTHDISTQHENAKPNAHKTCGTTPKTRLTNAPSTDGKVTTRHLARQRSRLASDTINNQGMHVRPAPFDHEPATLYGLLRPQ
eukprot:6134357-Prymnesium_polylepis.1